MTAKWLYSQMNTDEAHDCFLDESLSYRERKAKYHRLHEAMLSDAGWTQEEWHCELHRRLEFEPEGRKDILYHELSDEEWAAELASTPLAEWPGDFRPSGRSEQ